MEWVETTGRTIEEAKELALDQLRVDSDDAEFEILEEPKVGLFGRTRGSARVRARVVPKSPRPKTERRRRKRSDSKRGSDSRPDRNSAPKDAKAKENALADGSSKANQRGRSAERKNAKDANGSSDDRGRARNKETRERETMDMDEQTDVLRNFLEQLVKGFGLDATVDVSADDDTLRANITGEQLGLLVGPRLATLDAIQEISRHTLQRHANGREYARVVVDVEGIRERRREALSEFAANAATQVKDEDVTVVFEVMSSADRKIVHDVVTQVEGVESSSEGEDPRRRVVLRRA